MKRLFFIFLILILTSGKLFAGTSDLKEVVIYTGVDQIFSEPVLKEFEKKYQIKVKAVYDIEAVKTTGLVNRLIAEKKRPKCDVFWNNEFVRTIQLKRKGVLASYHSPSAKNIFSQYRDKEGYWTGFAARARVFVVNTNLISKKEYPKLLTDLTNSKWHGKVALANPMFGTTASHMAAIFAERGNGDARKLLYKMKENKVRIVDGNSVVRDMVGSGEMIFGLTDNDDVAVGKVSGLPIEALLPDQGTDTTLLIPNTVSLVAGAPHPAEARKLIDYLLSARVEQELIDKGFALLSLRKDSSNTPEQTAVAKAQKHNYDQLADTLNDAMKAVQEIFLN